MERSPEVLTSPRQKKIGHARRKALGPSSRKGGWCVLAKLHLLLLPTLAIYGQRVGGGWVGFDDLDQRLVDCRGQLGLVGLFGLLQRPGFTGSRYERGYGLLCGSLLLRGHLVAEVDLQCR
jgi:hypothetical protein